MGWYCMSDYLGYCYSLLPYTLNGTQTYTLWPAISSPGV